MTTGTIKFSHAYWKMPNHAIPNMLFDLKPTTLIQVLNVDRNQLSKEFLDYDDTYTGPDGKPAHFPVPDGPLLMLFLETGGVLWTTLRRSYPTKEKYYRDLVGKEVTIEMMR
jgi:hypothetical protein